MESRAWSRTAGALVVLGLGPSCDYFNDVVVPASDSVDPTVYAAVWRADVYEDISFGDDPFHHPAELDEFYVLIGAGVDAGGTKKITIAQQWIRNCKKGNIIDGDNGSLTTIVRTQPGSVGSTVSDGLWDGPFVRLSDYADCPAGWSLYSVMFYWKTTAEDFHGNVADHGWASIIWET